MLPPTKWMPLVHYREPQRGDIVVFIKPVRRIDADGKPQYLFLVKRLIGVPGDHIHLRDGIVIINGVAQTPAVGRQDAARAPDSGFSGRFSRPFRRRLDPAPPKAGPSTFPTTSSTATWSCRPATTS